MTREKAFETLTKYMTKPNLIKHSIAVEAVMKHFAKRQNEDELYWGNVGLLHDVDYEMYPNEHCKKTTELLKDVADEKFIRAIQSHGFELCCDVRPELYMEKVLCAIDQITGFLTACALILPTKKLADVTVESALKRWKKKDFAAGTMRERIEFYASELNISLEQLLGECIIAMNKISDELGL